MMWMTGKVKASYTVEATFILALTLFLILFAVRVGVTLHTEVKERACHYEKVQQFDAVSEVKTIKRVEKMMEE